VAERLEDLLRACTVRVTGGPEPGAGFLVAPGKVITCVHVIADCADGVKVSSGLKVQWERDGSKPGEFSVTGVPLVLADRGRAIDALDCDYPDIAVLDVAMPPGHPCVRIDAEWPGRGDLFQAYGYPSEGGTVRLTPASLEYRGTQGTRPTAYLDLARDTVKGGMSGAAALNLRTGGVSGVIVASKNPARPDGALAVPWLAVETELRDLLAANRAFHARDARWDTAVASLNASALNTAFPREAASSTAVPSTAAPAIEVIIEVAVADTGMLDTCVRVSGTVAGHQQARLPAEVADVWKALDLPALVAAERMADAGRRLAGALLDEAGQHTLARRLNEIPPGGSAEVILVADGPALSLPVELIRLASGDAGQVGPLGLLPNVSVSRRVAPPGTVPGGALPAARAPRPTAGPLKILAAVAAPDETKTPNAPLDVEAEMAAVLDATSGVTAGAHTQVRVLEVASLGAIRAAMATDAYHVLHLSAHGSPTAVELEDEDGAPVTVTSEALMNALKSSGNPVPLIVMSACSGGATGSAAMAAGLVARGADRVIAMLAPVTDDYATMLAGHFYRALSVHPSLAVGQALARARYQAEAERSALAKDRLPRPEYGVATLLATTGDAPLVDPDAKPEPLTVATSPPVAKGVRELPLDSLIGRRAQLRQVMGVLRRTRHAVERHGAASGVVLTGVGGIGKTAVAGRVMSRLRDDGWLIIVHEGRWNPTALIDATAAAVSDAIPRTADQALAGALQRRLELLADSDIDDGPKLGIVANLLQGLRMLVVFDDFEQNLTPGGAEFLDPAIEGAMTQLADAADTGALLLTCRYPLPGADRLLVPVPIPPLSGTELRRMFLRLPALRDLDSDDRRLLTRTIGGHPRLIEFTDALLRSRASLRYVETKLRDLARETGLDLAREVSLESAVNQAMLLGSADILLTELLGLLTARQADALIQVAVCYGAMSLDDLAFALGSVDHSPGAITRADVDRLTDLTLLTPGADIEMHPWTAALVTRNSTAELAPLHECALAMRYRRFEQQRGTYDDLIDIPRHLAALGRFNEIGGVAEEAVRILPGTLAVGAYLAELQPLIPPIEHAWTVVAQLRANAFLQAGDLPLATRQFQAMHEQVQTRAAADPANTGWQRDLSVSHNKLGDMAAAAGDRTAARTHYQAGLDIAARLAAADPANTQWQRDLSVSHDSLGDMTAAAGDLTAARTHYQASLDIRQRLAAADPANTGWQRDLSISHNKLGNVAADAGDRTAARTHYQADLDIAARLAAADPANTEWQRDLSISHNKLGNMAAAAGDLTTARASYGAALGIRERLAAIDPVNVQWQRDLEFVRQRIKDLPEAD
jgi:tetratricopeptide (TPR) repeat protein